MVTIGTIFELNSTANFENKPRVVLLLSNAKQSEVAGIAEPTSSCVLHANKLL